MISLNETLLSQKTCKHRKAIKLIEDFKVRFQQGGINLVLSN